jgi:peptide deformylase
MALLTILKYPDPRLRVKAKPVTTFSPELKTMVSDMYETMYANRGVGLAATQVNIHERIFVMDVSEQQNQRICAINPEIENTSGEVYESEGCLSVTNAFDKVKRAAKLTLRAYDVDGNSFVLQAEGLMAICVQHEIDHLNGILFIDHLSRLKQKRLQEKWEKKSR